MNTKQQIDNLKIGDTIIVFRKAGGAWRRGPRNIKNGSDEWTITGFTKTQIRANRYYEYANVARDSFTISWDLEYPEIPDEEECFCALDSCISCQVIMANATAVDALCSYLVEKQLEEFNGT
jgi:hypothetical protein